MAKFKALKAPIPSYLTAVLVEGSSWYIEYYIWNPYSNSTRLERKRKRIKKILKRFSNKSDQRREANRIVQELNMKLREGWNPFVEGDVPNAFKSIEESLSMALKVKNHNMRPDTIRSNNSLMGNFSSWLKKNKIYEGYIIGVSPQLAIGFIDHIYFERNNSARTRKNYLDFFTEVFDLLLKRKFVSENPFRAVDRVKVKRGHKKRTVIDKELRPQIIEYFSNNQPGFLYVINYLYECLIRRTEQTRIQIKDVNVKRQIIEISAEKSKNGKTRYATIPNSFLPYVKKLKLEVLPEDWYLVSRNNFFPGPHPVTPKMISDQWSKMRKELSIPQSNQFYSLRDSGVIDYLKSKVSAKAIVDQAQWHSYDMVNVYASHVDQETIQEIKISGKNFG